MTSENDWGRWATFGFAVVALLGSQAVRVLTLSTVPDMPVTVWRGRGLSSIGVG